MSWVDFLLGVLTGLIVAIGYLVYIINYRR
ncbi:hypothetical protein HUN42_00030 [Streptomyces phage Dagobah]|nr:hypothetical protein HUN42_00030 [Streptomyces phage Dagobah]